MSDSLPFLIRIFGLFSSWYVLMTIFFGSFIVNACQAIVSCCIFLSSRTRIAINQKLANTWWELFCYMTEVWSGIPYRFTGSTIIPNGGSCIMLGNHERGIDFTTGISVISRSGDIGCGRMMTMMKKSLQYVPTVGWTHYFQGSLFLNRNWETDSKAITAKLADMEQGRFPRPFWIGIYPEGTRITPTKKAASIKFAQERGLPQLQNVLLPRTKGFTFLIKNLPTSIDAIYDCTCAYSGSPLYLSHPFTKGGFITNAVHIHVDRIPFSALPKSEKEQSDWLMARFVEKDRLLEYFNQHGCFPGEEVVAHRPNFGHLLGIFAFWSTFLTLTSFALCGLQSPVPWILLVLQTMASFKSVYHIGSPRIADMKEEAKKQQKKAQ